VAAEWDHGGYDGNADSATISETRVAAGDRSDAYDVDPDVENYAAGNSPETAYRNQGNPDGPNGWNRFASEGAHAETGEADYGGGGDQHTELDETRGAGEAPDPWGDIHPDAANYPDLDGQGTASPEEREGSDHREPEPDRDDGRDTGQPDQAEPTKKETRRDLSPEQQRISALEAENADVRQKLADLEAKQKADNTAQSTRMDHLEQLLARSGQRPDGAGAREHTYGGTISMDQHEVQDHDPDAAQQAHAQNEGASIDHVRTPEQERTGVLEAENADASQVEPSAGITGQEYDAAEQSASRATREQRWHLPSDEGLALGAATAGGVITTVSDYIPYMHADVAGITASAVAVGAAAVTYLRKKREASNARRPEGRGTDPEDARPRHSR